LPMNICHWRATARLISVLAGHGACPGEPG
jgi:hypothetical protein